MATQEADGQSRSRKIEQVLWAVLLLNMAVAAAKFFYGLASGSESMKADGIHSFFDGFGNVIGLVSISFARRPADATHPYGHSKFETYGSLAIGVLLVLAAFEVGSSAIQKLMTGVYSAQVTGISFAVMVGTLIVNIGVTAYERTVGKRLHSQILTADAAHTLSDALVSIGVIAGLVLVTLGFPQADPIMALVVTAAIAIAAVQVFREAFRTLSDHACLSAADVLACTSQVSGVNNVHQIRTRGSEAEVYCDLHIQVDPHISVLEAHQMGNEVEECIKQAHPNVKEVLVHIEPLGDCGKDETPIVD